MPKTPQLTANYRLAYDKVKHLGLSTKEFRLILGTYHALLTKEMVDNGKVYMLPNSLGYIGVFKRNTVGKGMFNYKLYAEEGIKSFIKNRHSSNLAANFVWFHSFPYRGVDRHLINTFKFRAVRDSKRYLASIIKNENSIHIYNYIND